MDIFWGQYTNPFRIGLEFKIQPDTISTSDSEEFVHFRIRVFEVSRCCIQSKLMTQWWRVLKIDIVIRRISTVEGWLGSTSLNPPG